MFTKFITRKEIREIMDDEKQGKIMGKLIKNYICECMRRSDRFRKNSKSENHPVNFAKQN